MLSLFRPKPLISIVLTKNTEEEDEEQNFRCLEQRLEQIGSKLIELKKRSLMIGQCDNLSTVSQVEECYKQVRKRSTKKSLDQVCGRPCQSKASKCARKSRKTEPCSLKRRLIDDCKSESLSLDDDFSCGDQLTLSCDSEFSEEKACEESPGTCDELPDICEENVDEAECQETDSQETESQETICQEADCQEAESQEAESQEAESQEAESQEPECQEAECQEAENQEAENQEAEIQEEENQEAKCQGEETDPCEKDDDESAKENNCTQVMSVEPLGSNYRVSQTALEKEQNETVKSVSSWTKAASGEPVTKVKEGNASGVSSSAERRCVEVKGSEHSVLDKGSLILPVITTTTPQSSIKSVSSKTSSRDKQIDKDIVTEVRHAATPSVSAYAIETGVCKVKSVLSNRLSQSDTKSTSVVMHSSETRVSNPSKDNGLESLSSIILSKQKLDNLTYNTEPEMSIAKTQSPESQQQSILYLVQNPSETLLSSLPKKGLVLINASEIVIQNATSAELEKIVSVRSGSDGVVNAKPVFLSQPSTGETVLSEILQAPSKLEAKVSFQRNEVSEPQTSRIQLSDSISPNQKDFLIGSTLDTQSIKDSSTKIETSVVGPTSQLIALSNAEDAQNTSYCKESKLSCGSNTVSDSPECPKEMSTVCNLEAAKSNLSKAISLEENLKGQTESLSSTKNVSHVSTNERLSVKSLVSTSQSEACRTSNIERSKDVTQEQPSSQVVCPMKERGITDQILSDSVCDATKSTQIQNVSDCDASKASQGRFVADCFAVRTSQNEFNSSDSANVQVQDTSKVAMNEVVEKYASGSLTSTLPKIDEPIKSMESQLVSASRVTKPSQTQLDPDCDAAQTSNLRNEPMSGIISKCAVDKSSQVQSVSEYSAMKTFEMQCTSSDAEGINPSQIEFISDCDAIKTSQRWTSDCDAMKTYERSRFNDDSTDSNSRRSSNHSNSEQMKSPEIEFVYNYEEINNPGTRFLSDCRLFINDSGKLLIARTRSKTSSQEGSKGEVEHDLSSKSNVSLENKRVVNEDLGKLVESISPDRRQMTSSIQLQPLSLHSDLGNNRYQTKLTTKDGHGIMTTEDDEANNPTDEIKLKKRTEEFCEESLTDKILDLNDASKKSNQSSQIQKSMNSMKEGSWKLPTRSSFSTSSKGLNKGLRLNTPKNSSMSFLNSRKISDKEPDSNTNSRFKERRVSMASISSARSQSQNSKNKDTSISQENECGVKTKFELTNNKEYLFIHCKKCKEICVAKILDKQPRLDI